jgi:hypothetical protein
MGNFVELNRNDDTSIVVESSAYTQKKWIETRQGKTKPAAAAAGEELLEIWFE